MHWGNLLTTVNGLVLTICAVGSVVSAWATVLNAKKINSAKSQIQEVHILVNNRLDTALEKIARLQDQIKDSNGTPTT